MVRLFRLALSFQFLLFSFLSNSNSFVLVYHVHQNGWTKVSAQDMNDLHYNKYAKEQ